ncbi:hypothetical protein JTB14_035867 [Gonioctena quinquepunctata]|nr:hypothetical protein JTB14_035867 [Gonioctena quinquepunctata]
MIKEKQQLLMNTPYVTVRSPKAFTSIEAIAMNKALIAASKKHAMETSGIDVSLYYLTIELKKKATTFQRKMIESITSSKEGELLLTLDKNPEALKSISKVLVDGVFYADLGEW